MNAVRTPLPLWKTKNQVWHLEDTKPKINPDTAKTPRSPTRDTAKPDASESASRSTRCTSLKGLRRVGKFGSLQLPAPRTRSRPMSGPGSGRARSETLVRCSANECHRSRDCALLESWRSLSPNMVHSLNRRSRCSRVAAVDVVGQSSNSLNRWHTTAGINWWQPAILTQRKLARTGRLLVWRQGTWTEASTDAISLSCE